MKKAVSAVFSVIILLAVLCISVTAGTYAFQFEDGENSDENVREDFEKFTAQLPEDVKNRLGSESAESPEKIAESFDFDYFTGLISDSISQSIPSAMKTLCLTAALLIISALFRALEKAASTECAAAFNTCSMLCFALAFFAMQKSLFAAVGIMLSTLSNVMLTLLPFMESVYILSGNVTTAAVNDTGLGLMITFAQKLFDSVLAPGADICFLLAAVCSVTGNKGISQISGLLKKLLSGFLVTVMTLMSFVLTLQSGVASAADNFGIRTLKFAIGSYIPIIGGTIAESFSILASSVSVLKKASGVAGIVVIIIICLPVILTLAANRLSISISGVWAGLLECSREKDFIDEAGSIQSLLIAVSTAAAVMFIYAMSLFCRITPAYG